jgi:hypothetical protein
MFLYFEISLRCVILIIKLAFNFHNDLSKFELTQEAPKITRSEFLCLISILVLSILVL